MTGGLARHRKRSLTPSGVENLQLEQDSISFSFTPHPQTAPQPSPPYSQVPPACWSGSGTWGSEFLREPPSPRNPPQSPSNPHQDGRASGWAAAGLAVSTETVASRLETGRALHCEEPAYMAQYPLCHIPYNEPKRLRFYPASEPPNCRTVARIYSNSATRLSTSTARSGKSSGESLIVVLSDNPGACGGIVRIW